MNNRILLRSQKNEILTLIRDAGIAPSGFSWSEAASQINPKNTISTLLYINSDFFYSFEIRGESHYAIYSPANDSYIGTGYPGTWDGQKTSFSLWLEHLIRERNEPDLWKSLPANNHIGLKRYSDLQNRYITTEPSSETPAQEQMEYKLEKLLETNTATETYRSKPPSFLFRRYYGKA